MRLVTSFIVVLICTFTAFRGWEVTGFAATEFNLRPANGSTDALAAWNDVPGIAGTAREASLHQTGPGARAPERDRIRALDQLLAVRPMSSTEWLALAGARVATKAPEHRVMSALTMSYLTGPNEASIMFDRSLFGLLEWDTLPEDIQGRTARDLGGAMRSDAITDGGLRILKGVLDTEPSDTRSKLSAMLAAEQVSARQLHRAGL